MKTITVVYDPATLPDLAAEGEQAFDLFALLESHLNDAGVESQINLYQGDVRPAVEAPSMLDMLERCRAALPDAWLAVKSKVPRELIEDLNELLARYGR